MQTSAISSAALTGADTDALLKLIESIRAEKTAGVSGAGKISEIATSVAELKNDAPAAAASEDMAASETLPTLGRYVNIWA